MRMVMLLCSLLLLHTDNIMPKMPRPSARPAARQTVRPVQAVSMPKPTQVKPTPPTGGKAGAKGTVNFNPKPIDINDVCISTNCGQGREKPQVMPNPKPKHDPRFIAPKKIKHEQV